MSNRRIEKTSSKTAAYTCVSRACATYEKDPRFRGPDKLSRVLLPVPVKLMLQIAPLRMLFLRKLSPPGIYEYVLARTKIIDAIFIKALYNHYKQIVLLGAGFDTRALRFADINHGTTIFELDISTTQKPKIEILCRKKVWLPPELVFVPIDFNTERLSEVLSRAGYQEGQKSLFIWEGVTMYITPQAVDNTLAFIYSSAASESLIAFDYIYSSVLRQEKRFYGEQEIFKTVSNAGEGWTFGLEDGEILQFLSERGFKLIANYTPSDMEKTFLTAENGECVGRANGTHCIAIASVNKESPKSQI